MSYVNFDLQPGVVQDTLPSGVSFGQVHTDRDKDVYAPGETVNATFWGANLRNDYLRGMERRCLGLSNVVFFFFFFFSFFSLSLSLSPSPVFIPCFSINYFLYCINFSMFYLQAVAI